MPTTNLKAIEKIKADLEKSPLFYLSLSSNELFHSNFWQWFFKINPSGALALFTKKKLEPGEKPPHAELVKREKKHVDLTITASKFKIVIENKVKDIVHTKQLNEIKQKIDQERDDKVKEYIVVTLFPPEQDLPDDWKPLTYEELANRFDKLSTQGQGSYHKAIVDDYVKLIKNLSRLVKELPHDKQYNFFDCRNNKESMNRLNELRFKAGYLKYRCSQLADHILKKFPNVFHGVQVLSTDEYDEQHDEGNVITVGSGLSSRGHHGVVDVSYYLNNNASICVQIENGEYRHFLRTKNCGKKASKLREKGVWFTGDSDEYPDPQKREFRQYGGKDEHKYRFGKLEYGATFDYLADRIIGDFEQILGSKNKRILKEEALRV